MIEAVDGIVGLGERPDVPLQEKRRVRKIDGEAQIGLAVAPERLRQGGVRHAARVGLPAAVVRQPVGAGIGPEEMIERAVLEEEHDDVIDRRAATVQRLAAAGEPGGAGGQDEAHEGHGEESWTATAHGVF